MEGRVTGEFARILREHRHEFNESFKAARHSSRHLDPEQFLEHLADVVGPIVKAVQDNSDKSLDKLAVELYQQSLYLFSHGYLGKDSRYPALESAWRKLLVQIAPMMGTFARQVITRIGNAVVNLTVHPGADENRWVEKMSALVRLCPDIKTLLTAGIVLAWRLGMAHYRKGALKKAAKLSPDILADIFDLDKKISKPEANQFIDRLDKDPWHEFSTGGSKGKSRMEIKLKCGGFKGFGGIFINPPKVWSFQDRFFVSDTENTWVLFADVFGSSLRAVKEDIPMENKIPDKILPFRIEENGYVVFKNTGRNFPRLANASSWASVNNTLAVCLPFSHNIHVLGVAGGGEND